MMKNYHYGLLLSRGTIDSDCHVAAHLVRVIFSLRKIVEKMRVHTPVDLRRGSEPQLLRERMQCTYGEH